MPEKLVRKRLGNKYFASTFEGDSAEKEKAMGPGFVLAVVSPSLTHCILGEFPLFSFLVFLLPLRRPKSKFTSNRLCDIEQLPDCFKMCWDGEGWGRRGESQKLAY